MRACVRARVRARVRACVRMCEHTRRVALVSVRSTPGRDQTLIRRTPLLFEWSRVFLDMAGRTSRSRNSG